MCLGYITTSTYFYVVTTSISDTHRLICDIILDFTFRFFDYTIYTPPQVSINRS